MTDELRDKLNTHLEQLTYAMQTASLWQSEPPCQQAFNSSLPFCVDTMTFSEWLQFVFIIKMQHINQHGLPLPNQLMLLPMAEEAFKEEGDADYIVRAQIKNIDNLFN